MKVDLGEKNEKCCEQPVDVSAKSDTVWYPTFYVGRPFDDGQNKDLGELKGGQELQATVRVKSITRNEGSDGKVRFSYDFEVVSIETGEKEKPKTKTASSRLKEDEEAVEKGLNEAEKGEK